MKNLKFAIESSDDNNFEDFYYSDGFNYDEEDYDDLTVNYNF